MFTLCPCHKCRHTRSANDDYHADYPAVLEMQMKIRVNPNTCGQRYSESVLEDLFLQSIQLPVCKMLRPLRGLIVLTQYKYFKNAASFQLTTMMYFKFRVLPTLAVLTLASAAASSQGGRPIPPSGVCICMSLRPSR